MNKQSDLMKIVCNEDWREKKPDILRPVDETIPIYNPSEIYDSPAEYSTTRGVFHYTGVDVI